MHSVRSFYLTGDSHNTIIPDEMANGFIYTDFRANEFKKFVEDVQHNRDYTNYLYDKHEASRFNTGELIKVVERTLGTRI